MMKLLGYDKRDPKFTSITDRRLKIMIYIFGKSLTTGELYWFISDTQSLTMIKNNLKRLFELGFVAKEKIKVVTENGKRKEDYLFYLTELGNKAIFYYCSNLFFTPIELIEDAAVSGGAVPSAIVQESGVEDERVDQEHSVEDTKRVRQVS